jgi:hypothetical protein
MRLGCTGCLGGILGLALAGLLLAGVTVLSTRILVVPDVDRPVTTAADGSRAQRKIFELARRDRQASVVTLTEPEVSALLDRHVVEAGGARLSGLRVQLKGDDRVQLGAVTTVGRVLDEVGLGPVAGALPGRWQARSIYLGAGARVSITDESPRQLRLDLETFTLGRQSLPTPMLRLLVDPGTLGLLRWRLPSHIQRVSIEPGRVVIYTAGRGAGLGPSHPRKPSLYNHSDRQERT